MRNKVDKTLLAPEPKHRKTVVHRVKKAGNRTKRMKNSWYVDDVIDIEDYGQLDLEVDSLSEGCSN